MIFHGPVLQVPGYQIQQAQWARQSRIAARDASGAQGGTLRDIFEPKNSWILEEIIATNQSVGYPQIYSRWEILYIEFLRSCHMLIVCWNAPLRLHVMWHVTHMVNQVIHGEGIFFSLPRKRTSFWSFYCLWLGKLPLSRMAHRLQQSFQETHSSWARSCTSKKRRGLSTWMILVSYIFSGLYKPRSLCRSLHGSAPLASQFKVKLVNMSFVIYLHSDTSQSFSVLLGFFWNEYL